MLSKPRSLLFDDIQAQGQGGCHVNGVALPLRLAASADFSPEAAVQESTSLWTALRWQRCFTAPACARPIAPDQMYFDNLALAVAA